VRLSESSNMEGKTGNSSKIPVASEAEDQKEYCQSVGHKGAK
jgi:hypothetical protein